MDRPGPLTGGTGREAMLKQLLTYSACMSVRGTCKQLVLEADTADLGTWILPEW